MRGSVTEVLISGAFDMMVPLPLEAQGFDSPQVIAQNGHIPHVNLNSQLKD
jgi:hypothetical protein